MWGCPACRPGSARAIAADPSHQQVQIISISSTDGGSVPAAIVGSRVTLPAAGQYELYFVFPLEREQQTLRVVARTFALGGIALVLLLGAVAYVVTRLVVDPVRRAALVAERLSSGRLHERMRAHGEDDIAKLGKSFNAMADSLQKQIRQLEDLSRVQQRFVSDVSHELRTPLTTIRMAGDLIHDSRHDFDPSVARSAELLHNEIDRFESLLSDLLEISRFDAGAAALDVEATDLRDTIERTIESTAALAARRGSRLEVIPTDGPCVAEIDPRRVERILRNLVVNAIEYGEGRPVTVQLGVNAKAVAVSVRDSGVGLRPGEAALVFNRFWRADPARARTTGGTGLGLAISREDARLHEGWLHAWGEPGVGSCFRLTLPRHTGGSDRELPLAAAASGRGSSGERVSGGGSQARYRLRGSGVMRRARPLVTCAVPVVVALAAVLGLSGCGGLPSSSAVQQGSLVGEPALQPVRVQPDGPAAGATPEQIVRGFLRAGAGAGFDDDHAVARSFFARSVKDHWLPDSGVKVYGDDSALKVELLTPGSVRVTAAIVAEVDSAGRYRETPAGTLARATFGMQKLRVGWRISQPPKGFGLWLSASDLDRTYRSFTVAYVSKVARTMVGDRRWFPITPGLATTLARAQLAPVPAYLTGAARTGIPAGTTLAVDSVPIQSGRAVVDLSASALSANPDLRRAMWAQFVTTLMQVASVTQVSLEVKGAGLDLPDTPGRVSTLTALGYQSHDLGCHRDGHPAHRQPAEPGVLGSPPDQDQPPKLPASSVLPKIPTGWVSLALSWKRSGDRGNWRRSRRPCALAGESDLPAGQVRQRPDQTVL